MQYNSKTLTISTKRGKIRILKTQIVSCQEFMVGTLLTLHNKKSYLLKEGIGDLKYFLSEKNFFIPNRDSIINLEYFEALFSDEIVLSRGRSFKLQEDRKNSLISRLQLYEKITN